MPLITTKKWIPYLPYRDPGPNPLRSGTSNGVGVGDGVRVCSRVCLYVCADRAKGPGSRRSWVILIAHSILSTYYVYFSIHVDDENKIFIKSINSHFISSWILFIQMLKTKIWQQKNNSLTVTTESSVKFRKSNTKNLDHIRYPIYPYLMWQEKTADWRRVL
jgi:hypothetical protein